MKKIVLFLLCAVILAACLSGCVVTNFPSFGGAGVRGEGDLQRYEYPVGGYSAIVIKGHCQINYYASSSDAVTLDIQPNLEEYVSLEVVGGTLVFRYTKNISTSGGKTPVLTVSTPALNSLTVEGACELKAFDTITADSFTFQLSGAASGTADLDVKRLSIGIAGAGSLKLSGTADSADFRLSGAGELEALALQTREANVELGGVGTVRVNCSETLRIDAGGMGTVEYKGSPGLDLSKGGLVTIKKID
ncbi:MAG: DUF2807 domain-containing protein [Oscillospiraceae bacterium]|nr:DUF2807 domain-containing protein [Oscillospiraceae bacterium]